MALWFVNSNLYVICAVRHLCAAAVGQVPGDGVLLVRFRRGAGEAVDIRAVGSIPLGQMTMLDDSPSSDRLDERAGGILDPDGLDVLRVEIELASRRGRRERHHQLPARRRAGPRRGLASASHRTAAHAKMLLRESRRLTVNSSCLS